MVINLDADILEAIEMDTFTNEGLRSIEMIAEAFLGKTHYVIGPPKLLIKLSELGGLSERQRNAYSYISNNMLSLNELKKSPYQILLKNSTEFSKVKDGKITTYIYPLCEVIKSKLLNIPCLISESGKDCSFYKNMSKFTKSDLCDYGNHNIEIRSVSGGGAATGKTLEDEIDEGYICIVIADSDKKYPNCKDGQTYSLIKRVIEKLNQKENCVFEVKRLNVREKENLITPKIYKLIEREKNYHEIINDLSLIYGSEVLREWYYYMDIKDGEVCKSFIKNEKLQEYYKKFYKEKNENIDFLTFPSTYDELIERTKSRETIFCGCSSMIDQVESDIFCGKLERRIKEMEDINMLSKKVKIPTKYINDMKAKYKESLDIYPYLCENLKNDWEIIAKLVSSFGCAPSKALI